MIPTPTQASAFREFWRGCSMCRFCYRVHVGPLEMHIHTVSLVTFSESKTKPKGKPHPHCCAYIVHLKISNHTHYSQSQSIFNCNMALQSNWTHLQTLRIENSMTSNWQKHTHIHAMTVWVPFSLTMTIGIQINLHQNRLLGIDRE